MDELEAEFYRSGAVGVNRKLRELFPKTADRVEMLLSMEASGKWEVKMHRSSDGPDEFDDGAVIDYAG
ncbi:MAG: hypothetical protein ABS75_07960 [Pelagibacterium sp. SCN 63-23]|nr:MAG: hypothetical protein ABS75_07960 [Pelagibacterium sp. SCN 63-23]